MQGTEPSPCRGFRVQKPKGFGVQVRGFRVQDVPMGADTYCVTVRKSVRSSTTGAWPTCRRMSLLPWAPPRYTIKPTLPYPTLPYPTLPYPTLPYPTLPYPTLPHLNLSYPTRPYPTADIRARDETNC